MRRDMREAVCSAEIKRAKNSAARPEAARDRRGKRRKEEKKICAWRAARMQRDEG